MSLLGRKLTVPGGYHPWWTFKKKQKNKKPKSNRVENLDSGYPVF